MDFEPKVYRTVIFVRHGQYSSAPEQLTELGQKQAQLTAKALVALKPTKVHCSTMPRAIETGRIIAQKMKLKIKLSDLFREGRLPGTPTYHKAISKGLSAEEKADLFERAKKTKKKANKAFNILFTKPTRGQHTEVVVAHGNVIRYWVCKALDIPEEKWLKMDILHGSLTTIRVSKSGNLVLLGFSEVGHLPLKMRTYV